MLPDRPVLSFVLTLPSLACTSDKSGTGVDITIERWWKDTGYRKGEVLGGKGMSKFPYVTVLRMHWSGIEVWLPGDSLHYV